MNPTTLVIGASSIVHVGWIRDRSVLSYDPWAETYCGAGGPLSGPPRAVDKPVTCPGCKHAQPQRRAA
jgi:hypothetical protein